MNVEREIAGFALPFTAGVLAAAYIGVLFCGDPFLIHTIAFTAIILSAAFLLQRGKFCLTDRTIWILTGIGALGCGLLSGFTSINHIRLPGSEIRSIANSINLNIQSAIDAVPFRNEESTALVKALLTGERNSLAPHIKEAFRASGASHILALSGLHLGIIYALINRCISILGNSRMMKIIRSATTIGICGIYTMATGAGDSLVRAYIFIILGETARLTGRYHSLGHILLTSLIIQLILFPQAIRSVGFQLSYAAMAGIAFIFPWLKGFWNRAEELFKRSGSDREENESIVAGTLSRPIKWIWNSVALSISCQLTTGPLAYFYFGTFPQNFMLTNLLALPLTGILIPAALLTLILSWTGCCPSVMVEATEYLIRMLIRILEIIASM